MKKKISRRFEFGPDDVIEALNDMMSNRDMPTPSKGQGTWSHTTDGTFVLEWTEGA
jgi:hypothetical protein